MPTGPAGPAVPTVPAASSGPMLTLGQVEAELALPAKVFDRYIADHHEG